MGVLKAAEASSAPFDAKSKGETTLESRRVGLRVLCRRAYALLLSKRLSLLL